MPTCTTWSPRTWSWYNCAPPFKVAECDILFGFGISREGGLIDLGVEQSIVRKSGAWYTYEGDQLAQGKENARNSWENPDMANEIEKKIRRSSASARGSMRKRPPPLPLPSTEGRPAARLGAVPAAARAGAGKAAAAPGAGAAARAAAVGSVNGGA